MMNRLGILVAAVASLLATMAAANPNLVIVEQPGCVYCQQWDREIAPAYPNTAEGRFAPLIRADLREGPPDGITYARRVTFTPTFILVENGVELARIEGYPGDDFFWPLLSRMLEAVTEFTAPDDTAVVN